MIRVLSLVLIGFFSMAAFAKPAKTLKLSCEGPLVQGGFVICYLPPDSGTYEIVSSGNKSSALISGDRPALIPFARNSDLQVSLRHKTTNADEAPAFDPVFLNLQESKWAIERVDGLPPGKVTPRTPEQQKRVEADWLKKQAAWKHRAAASWYDDGFLEPVANYRTSGEYGSQRILNGQPKNPHLGLDFAAPSGTDITAPAGAIVVLAEPDMYFEGGLLILDHGDGVMSVMLHLSRLDVKVGDTVSKGDLIGAIGMTGRATGPHLHWGVKVRGTYINPKLLLGYKR